MRWLLAALLVLFAGSAHAQLPQTQCVSTTVAAGTGDAITIPLLPCSETTTLLVLTFSAANVTSAPTISVNGQTPHGILNFDTTVISVGQFQPNQHRILTYNGANWILLNSTGGGGGSCSIATLSSIGCVKPDGTTITVNGSGVLTAATATSSTLGIVKPDNSTITIANGVITAVSGGVACSNSNNFGCLTSNNSWTAGNRATWHTLTISGSTFTPDFNVGQNFSLVLSHGSCPCTLANPANPSPLSGAAGQSGMFEIIQSASGSDTIGTYGTSYLASTEPTLSTTANAKDYVSYTVNPSGNIVFGSPVLNAH